MSKQRFSYAQRYALWRAYGMKCFYCDRPLDLQNLTIDHVLPEHLADEPEELDRLLHEYEVEANFPSFSIKDYSNWVPSDGQSCNYRKGTSVFPKQFTLFLLNRIQNNLPTVAAELSRLAKTREQTEVLGRLAAAIESDVTSKEQVLDLLRDLEFQQTREEPLVVTYGVNVLELREKSELPGYLKRLSYPELCDRLESELVERLRAAANTALHYSEPSGRNGETLSVRLVFPFLTVDNFESVDLASVEHFMPWWELLEVTNFYQVYQAKYDEAFPYP